MKSNVQGLGPGFNSTPNRPFKKYSSFLQVSLLASLLLIQTVPSNPTRFSWVMLETLYVWNPSMYGTHQHIPAHSLKSLCRIQEVSRPPSQEMRGFGENLLAVLNKLKKSKRTACHAKRFLRFTDCSLRQVAPVSKRSLQWSQKPIYPLLRRRQQPAWPMQPLIEVAPPQWFREGFLLGEASVVGTSRGFQPWLVMILDDAFKTLGPA